MPWQYQPTPVRYIYQIYLEVISTYSGQHFDYIGGVEKFSARNGVCPEFPGSCLQVLGSTKILGVVSLFTAYTTEYLFSLLVKLNLGSWLKQIRLSVCLSVSIL